MSGAIPIPALYAFVTCIDMTEPFICNWGMKTVSLMKEN